MDAAHVACAARRWAAWAEEAQDVTAQCALSASVNQGSVRNVCAEKIDRCWDGLADGTLTVRLPAGKTAQGVSLSFFCDVPHLVVCDADGTLLADWNEPYYNAWIPFSRPSAKFTIRRAGFSGGPRWKAMRNCC